MKEIFFKGLLWNFAGSWAEIVEEREKKRKEEKIIDAKLKGLWSHVLPSNGKVTLRIQTPQQNIAFNIKLNHSDDDVRAI